MRFMNIEEREQMDPDEERKKKEIAIKKIKNMYQ